MVLPDDVFVALATAATPHNGFVFSLADRRYAGSVSPWGMPPTSCSYYIYYNSTGKSTAMVRTPSRPYRTTGSCTEAGVFSDSPSGSGTLGRFVETVDGRQRIPQGLR